MNESLVTHYLINNGWKTSLSVLKKSGISICAINCYARSFNSYLTWLYKEGYVSEPLRLALLREQKRVFKPLTDQQLRAILSHKPRTFGERRFHTLLCLAVDVGCRIEEAMTLKRSDVDMDNLVIRIYGKGRRNVSSRSVPN